MELDHIIEDLESLDWEDEAFDGSTQSALKEQRFLIVEDNLPLTLPVSIPFENIPNRMRDEYSIAKIDEVSQCSSDIVWTREDPVVELHQDMMHAGNLESEAIAVDSLMELSSESWVKDMEIIDDKGQGDNLLVSLETKSKYKKLGFVRDGRELKPARIVELSQATKSQWSENQSENTSKNANLDNQGSYGAKVEKRNTKSSDLEDNPRCGLKFTKRKLTGNDETSAEMISYSCNKKLRVLGHCRKLFADETGHYSHKVSSVSSVENKSLVSGRQDHGYVPTNMEDKVEKGKNIKWGRFYETSREKVVNDTKVLSDKTTALVTNTEKLVKQTAQQIALIDDIEQGRHIESEEEKEKKKESSKKKVREKGSKRKGNKSFTVTGSNVAAETSASDTALHDSANPERKPITPYKLRQRSNVPTPYKIGAGARTPNKTPSKTKPKSPAKSCNCEKKKQSRSRRQRNSSDKSNIKETSRKAAQKSPKSQDKIIQYLKPRPTGSEHTASNVEKEKTETANVKKNVRRTDPQMVARNVDLWDTSSETDFEEKETVLRPAQTISSTSKFSKASKQSLKSSKQPGAPEASTTSLKSTSRTLETGLKSTKSAKSHVVQTAISQKQNSSKLSESLKSVPLKSPNKDAKNVAEEMEYTKIDFPDGLKFEEITEDDQLVLVQAPPAFLLHQINEKHLHDPIPYGVTMTLSCYKTAPECYHWKMVESSTQKLSHVAVVPDIKGKHHAVRLCGLVSIRKAYDCWQQ